MARFVKPWDRLGRADRRWLAVFATVAVLLAAYSSLDVPATWRRLHSVPNPSILTRRSSASRINLDLFLTTAAFALMLQPAARLLRAGRRSQTTLDKALRELPDGWVVFSDRPWENDARLLVEDTETLARWSRREDRDDPSADRFVVGPAGYALILSVEQIDGVVPVAEVKDGACALASLAGASLSPHVLGPLAAPLPVVWGRASREALVWMEGGGWLRCRRDELAAVLQSHAAGLTPRQRASIVSLMANRCRLAGERMVEDANGVA